jgi:catechol 2,3-dioxygenase-like lactoylglutathione lyase family enzyme
MRERPRTTLTATVLDTPDPQGLARFYAALLDWPIGEDHPEWATLRPGGPGLSFQLEREHVPPVWPAAAGDQRMQLHLDVQVEDLVAATAFAQSLGAQVAEFQPQDDVRVLLDPAGHPFCLFMAG